MEMYSLSIYTCKFMQQRTIKYTPGSFYPSDYFARPILREIYLNCILGLNLTTIKMRPADLIPNKNICPHPPYGSLHVRKIHLVSLCTHINFESYRTRTKFQILDQSCCSSEWKEHWVYSESHIQFFVKPEVY